MQFIGRKTLLFVGMAAFAISQVVGADVRAATLNIPSLGAVSPGSLGGWYGDDMRSDGTGGVAGSTNLIGINRTINTATYGAVYTNQPAAGIVLHDAAINNQVIFGAAPAGAPGWKGSVNLRSNNPANTFNTKSQIASIIDGTVGTGSGSTGGHAQGSVLSALSGFSIQYSWFGTLGASTNVTPALKFGFKTSDFASTGLSTRTGENAWDKVLVYDPSQNGNIADGLWHTETINFNTGKWLFFDRTAPSGSGPVSLTLANMSTSPTVYAGTKTVASAFAKMTSADAVITSVQFGIGSTAIAGDTYVNQLMVSFLNGGDLMTFGTEPPIPVAPEPGSLVLLGLGSLLLMAKRRRR